MYATYYRLEVTMIEWYMWMKAFTSQLGFPNYYCLNFDVPGRPFQTQFLQCYVVTKRESKALFGANIKP